MIARHCAGGLILGFEQFHATAGTWKRGLGAKHGEKKLAIKETASFPTPWNQLEAGILFGLGLPLLVFKEPQITGGVFDAGVTDVFIHKMPGSKLPKKDRDGLKEVILKWYARTSERYFSIGRG